ncbi:hypothetical protein SSP24_59780 [Streptomyces spinoverrucosus]|uniref:HEAT repeat domain-containing protein n=1 Tax=Streptomyces spinoverrucosus TaxID=284043 RepID=A0A4Y3VP03_9ACTN|nr:hypothetical protein [Streptomyces spinoverrucosus]GEC08323.1 hypothetical protein SSP24_59780 [Streptomyces spinoverrucosus]GHB83868.1 hypothetical protein GCM10010397_63870 [Streptomyces spinoverrucosus]
MKSPAELDAVQWHTLTHAYGSAEDVPELIRALYEGDEETADEAIYELFGNIHHQGTVYPASAPAVPFLAHAVRHAPGKRDQLLMLLAVLADHDPADIESPHWPVSSVAGVCAELCRVLPELLPCLEDGERVVRRAALRVVAAVAELLPAELRTSVEHRIEELYATDPVPAVRADAMVVLARFDRETAAAALDSPLPEVRLAAAMLVAERSGPPYPAELVKVIAEDGAEPDPGDDDFPWSGTTTSDEQLTRLLTRDADAGLAVAARWIAAGDIGSRGSWLAEQIAETWRDREPEVLDLLQSALPHQKDTRGLAGRLRTIGHWIEYLPEPGAGLRDALYRHTSADDETAEPALLALVRSRDPRALELVLRRPCAKLLEAAARHFPEAADRLIPVIRRELASGATGNAGIALVGALTPFGAAARQAQPELVDCLRTGRAAIVAARQIGLNGIQTQEVTDLLRNAANSNDSSLSAAAAVAHYQLTGDAGQALDVFERLLSARGQPHWYLSSLQPLGSAAAPLLPFIEPLLEAGYEWTRMAAAEAHHWITGSTDRAVPVLVELVGPTPVGLRALKALAATRPVPEELRPTLRSFAFSPLRLLSDSPFSGQGHEDEELRTLARTLLTAD